jgi:hypothetical protein
MLQSVSGHLVHLGRDLRSRDLFLMSLGSWEDWPRELKLPSRHFCLLVAGDAQSTSDDAIGSLADAALDDGCVYMCAWGPGCERVHTSFDTRIVDRDLAGVIPDVLGVMTTSHETETLDEALDFLTGTAWPDKAFADSCRTALIAVVGNAEWVTSIRGRFER